MTIDGKFIEAEAGTTIILAARKAGIDIPHLCEFEHLTPHGGCRMCVVEVEGVNTLQTSCTYPVGEGMVVQTNTDKVKNARKFVLSLLFGDRNHFCMVCPATNGDCELQSAAYSLEMDHWLIQPGWEKYSVDSSHPWMIWDQNRCILCQRCVRACEELSGNHTIVPLFRGAAMMLTTDQNLPWGESSCVKCGTCLQVCPTGAIMDRRSAYWGNIQTAEMQKGLCVECGVGCSTEVFSRSNQVLKIDGDWDGEINRGVLCELGRFKSIQAINQTRIDAPRVVEGRQKRSISWDEAIGIVSDKLYQKPSSAMISARFPIETLVSFKEMLIALGCETVSSSENSGDQYAEILEVIGDPQKAIVSPDYFGKRGKANSKAAQLLGLTSGISAQGKTLFLAIGDDPEIGRYQSICEEAQYLIVAATYESELTKRADLVLPIANWAETGGHYLNLINQLRVNPAMISPPIGVRDLNGVLRKLAEIAEIELLVDWKNAIYDSVV